MSVRAAGPSPAPWQDIPAEKSKPSIKSTASSKKSEPADPDEDDSRIQEFINHMDTLNAAKPAFEKLWQKTPWELEAQKKVEKSIESRNRLEDKPEFRQVGLDGRVAGSMADLYAVAQVVKPRFDELVADLGEMCGLKPSDVLLAPLKSKDSTVRKLERYVVRHAVTPDMDKEARSAATKLQPPVSWVLDVVRASLIARTAEQVLDLFDTLSAKEANEMMRGTNKGWEIVRVRNRFDLPLLHGYRDLLVSVRMFHTDDQGIQSWHTCELQIHVLKLYQYSVAHGTPRLFQYFRPLFLDGMYANLPESKKKFMDLQALGESWKPARQAREYAKAKHTDLMKQTLLVWFTKRATRSSKGKFAKKPLLKTLQDDLVLLQIIGYVQPVALIQDEILLQVEEEEDPNLKPDGERTGEGKANMRYATTLAEMAQILHKTDIHVLRHARAEELAREALATAESLADKVEGGDTAVTQMLTILNEIQYAQGQYEEVGEISGRLIAMQEEQLPVGHPARAVPAKKTAMWLKSQGQDEEAIPVLEDCLLISQTALGSNHSQVGATQQALVDALTGSNQLKEAVEMKRRMLRTYIDCFGVDHPGTATFMAEYATLLIDTAQYKEAQEVVDKVLGIHRRLHGDVSAVVSKFLIQQGKLACLLGNPIRGEGLLREALEIDEQLFGEESLEATKTSVALAIVMREVGSLEASARLLDEGLPILKAELGETCIEVAEVYSAQSELLKQQGLFDDAQTKLELCIELYTQLVGPNAPRTVEAMRSISELLYIMGFADEGAAYMRQVAAITGEELEDDMDHDPGVAEEAAAAAEMQGEPEQAAGAAAAAGLLDQIFEGEEEEGDMDDWGTVGNVDLAEMHN